MDRLTAFVAIAHLKLRLETLQRHPEILDMAVAPPKLPAPMQLAGLGSRLKRGTNLEARAGAVGPRIDNAHDVIESGIVALENYAPGLEQYGNDLMNQIKRLSEPSNGGPLLEEPVADPTGAAPPPPPGPNGGPRIL